MSTFYCKICGQQKPAEDFTLRLRTSGERTPNSKACKPCRSAAEKDRRKTPEYKKAYQLYSQTESRKQSNKRRDQSEKGKAARKRYSQSEKGKVKIAKTTKAWKQTPGVAAVLSMREKLRRKLADGDHNSSYAFGFERADLVQWIESKWLPGMTWTNYGYRDGDYESGWDIDHAIPASAFDHTNEQDVHRCWSLQNLRPMWHKTNLKKSSTLQDIDIVPQSLWPTSWNGVRPTSS